jgi:hypothetical protein
MRSGKPLLALLEKYFTLEMSKEMLKAVSNLLPFELSATAFSEKGIM